MTFKLGIALPQPARVTSCHWLDKSQTVLYIGLSTKHQGGGAAEIEREEKCASGEVEMDPFRH